MAIYRSPDMDTFQWQGSVQDKDQNSPPGGPTKGNRQIVGPSPTGAWVGHANQVTYYDGSNWQFITAVEGIVAWVEDENKCYAWNGSAWSEFGASATTIGYCVQAIAQNLVSLTDSATYYFGSTSEIPSTTSAVKRIYIPKAGTIKYARIFWNAGTAGSDEDISVYIRANDSADTLIATVADTNTIKVFANDALAISISGGQYIEIKVVCPAWGTNPANVKLAGTIYIE